MFDRLQRPFLTVETGEAYQPIRITYDLCQPAEFSEKLANLKCFQKNGSFDTWNWYWKEECQDVHFESLDSFRKNNQNPTRLGTLTFRDNKLYLNLPSFKRACLAVAFFYKTMSDGVLQIRHADFINKVFALDERLPHGFTELFKDDELDRILHERFEDYNKVKEQCEQAQTADDAFKMLAEYTQKEAKKRLPYAERYTFETSPDQDAEILFLAFYIFLRSRELVAIKRWFGQAGYTLSDAADETVEQVFGSIDTDIVE